MKFIHDTTTLTGIDINDRALAQDIQLEKDVDYNVQLVYDGPQIVINGEQVVDPNANIMCVLQQEGVIIPIAPELINKFWET